MGGAVGLGRDRGGAVERASFPHSRRKWRASVSGRRRPARVGGEEAKPPGAGRLTGASGWRGGGFCAQTGECGKYAVSPILARLRFGDCESLSRAGHSTYEPSEEPVSMGSPHGLALRSLLWCQEKPRFF